MRKPGGWARLPWRGSCLEASPERLGIGHVQSLSLVKLLCKLFRLQGRFDESVKVIEEALALERQAPDSTHKLTVLTILELRLTCEEAGDPRVLMFLKETAERLGEGEEALQDKTQLALGS